MNLSSLYFSDARNPFVEQAVQYVIAAAHARIDQDKKDILQKRLLLGDSMIFNIRLCLIRMYVGIA